MNELELQLGGLLLVFSRVAGLFLFAPILASVTVPMRVRAMLGITFALIIWLSLPRSQQLVEMPDVISAGWMVMMETSMGMIIGLIALLPVIAVQLGSALFGQQMGFGLAAVYNPALETESDVLGELMLYVALGVFLSFGGLEKVFLAVAMSFATTPPGTFSLSAAPLALVQTIVTAGTELAFRIALPVLCVLTIETLSTAFITKTMPQLNVMSLGYGAKIMMGIVALIGSLVAVQSVVGDHIRETFDQLALWLSL